MHDQLDHIIQLLNTTQLVMTPPSNSGGALGVHKPQDCRDVQLAGSNVSGVYTVYPDDGGEHINVFCDMVTDGGGWTVSVLVMLEP